MANIERIDLEPLRDGKFPTSQYWNKFAGQINQRILDNAGGAEAGGAYARLGYFFNLIHRHDYINAVAGFARLFGATGETVSYLYSILRRLPANRDDPMDERFEIRSLTKFEAVAERFFEGLEEQDPTGHSGITYFPRRGWAYADESPVDFGSNNLVYLDNLSDDGTEFRSPRAKIFAEVIAAFVAHECRGWAGDTEDDTGYNVRDVAPPYLRFLSENQMRFALQWFELGDKLDENGDPVLKDDGTPEQEIKRKWIDIDNDTRSFERTDIDPPDPTDSYRKYDEAHEEMYAKFRIFELVGQGRYRLTNDDGETRNVEVDGYLWLDDAGGWKSIEKIGDEDVAVKVVLLKVLKPRWMDLVLLAYLYCEREQLQPRSVRQESVFEYYFSESLLKVNPLSYLKRDDTAPSLDEQRRYYEDNQFGLQSKIGRFGEIWASRREGHFSWEASVPFNPRPDSAPTAQLIEWDNDMARYELLNNNDDKSVPPDNARWLIEGERYAVQIRLWLYTLARSTGTLPNGEEYIPRLGTAVDWHTWKGLRAIVEMEYETEDYEHTSEIPNPDYDSTMPVSDDNPETIPETTTFKRHYLRVVNSADENIIARLLPDAGVAVRGRFIEDAAPNVPDRILGWIVPTDRNSVWRDLFPNLSSSAYMIGFPRLDSFVKLLPTATEDTPPNITQETTDTRVFAYYFSDAMTYLRCISTGFSFEPEVDEDAVDDPNGTEITTPAIENSAGAAVIKDLTIERYAKLLGLQNFIIDAEKRDMFAVVPNLNYGRNVLSKLNDAINLLRSVRISGRGIPITFTFTRQKRYGHSGLINSITETGLTESGWVSMMEGWDARQDVRAGSVVTRRRPPSPFADPTTRPRYLFPNGSTPIWETDENGDRVINRVIVHLTHPAKASFVKVPLGPPNATLNPDTFENDIIVYADTPETYQVARTGASSFEFLSSAVDLPNSFFRGEAENPDFVGDLMLPRFRNDIMAVKIRRNTIWKYWEFDQYNFPASQSANSFRFILVGADFPVWRQFFTTWDMDIKLSVRNADLFRLGLTKSQTGGDSMDPIFTVNSTFRVDSLQREYLSAGGAVVNLPLQSVRVNGQDAYDYTITDDDLAQANRGLIGAGLWSGSLDGAFSAPILVQSLNDRDNPPDHPDGLFEASDLDNAVSEDRGLFGVPSALDSTDFGALWNNARFGYNQVRNFGKGGAVSVAEISLQPQLRHLYD